MSNKLPKDWEIVSISKIGKIETGTTPSKAVNEYYGSEYPFYKPSDLDAGINVFKSIDGLTKLGVDKARYVAENTTLVTCIGATIGKTGYLKKGGGFNQQINAIIPNVGVNPKFIYYQAIGLDFQKQIKDNASATTLPLLNKSKFQLLTMVTCPLEIQNLTISKIEELFSELDKGIEDLKTAQQQLKTYRQSVLKYAFEGKLTNKKVKDGELPKGWEYVNMSSVIEKPKYGTSKKCDYGIDGIGVLRIPNISKGTVDSSDLKFAKFDDKEIEAYSLIEGDILTIRSNGSVDLVGKCALISKKDEACLYAGYLIRLRPIMSKVNPKYLINILSSIDLRNQIEDKAKSTSGVNNINSEELSTLKIQLPPIEEQHRIVQEIESRLSVADKMEESIAQSILQAEALRQSILKKAFSGELV